METVKISELIGKGFYASRAVVQQEGKSEVRQKM